MSDSRSQPRPTGARDEQTVFGVRAALAVLTHRPQAVRRIFHAPALRQQLGPHLSAAAQRRIPYRELDPEALAKAAGSPHHEGLAVVAEPLRYRALAPSREGRPALWLALDGVENPHNLGAILRTAAFFGVSGVVAGGTAPGEKVNAAVLRVAEGGAEWVPLFGAPDLSEALGDLRGAGCRVVGLETDGSRPLGQAVSGRAADRPLVLTLGQEHSGLTAAARSACDELCRLVGGGPMVSLNVSVAAAVALAEIVRTRNSNEAAWRPPPLEAPVPEPPATTPRPPPARRSSPTPPPRPSTGKPRGGSRPAGGKSRRPRGR